MGDRAGSRSSVLLPPRRARGPGSGADPESARLVATGHSHRAQSPQRAARRLNNQAPRLTWPWMRERASPQPYLQSSSSSMACLLSPSLPLSSSAISACADRHGPDKCCMAACAAAPHAAALPLHLSLLWRGLSQCILVRPVGPEPPLEALSRDPQPTVVAWHVVRDERRREFLRQH